MITVSLHIVNTYDDGEVITTVITGAEVAGPPPDGDLDDWAEHTIYPLTGTGKTDGDLVRRQRSRGHGAVPVGWTEPHLGTTSSADSRS